MSRLALSVLDLVPVREGQSSADAVAATVALARRADRLGFTRYWLAEHHNVPSVASTNPAVLLGLLAGQTERIRLGSGGVMLPNHAPLVVAEQFALLEAAAPGRIDLGIGRAPGSDPTVSALLRSTGHASDVSRLPEHLEQIRAMISPEGAILPLVDGDRYRIAATSAAASAPEMFVLGTSEYPAGLAASLGLPYVVAHQFSESHTERLMATYRERFRPSERTPEPHAILTVTLVVADSDEEARRLALPQVLHMVRLGSGQAQGVMDTVESAAAVPLAPQEEELVETFLERLFIGEAGAVSDRLAAFAERLEVDEAIVGPAAGGSDSDPLVRFPARERTLDLLAERLLAPEAATDAGVASTGALAR